MSGERERCGTCRFFEPGADVCKLKPPVVVVYQSFSDDDLQARPHTEWPEVRPAEWCGSWKDGRP